MTITNKIDLIAPFVSHGFDTEHYWNSPIINYCKCTACNYIQYIQLKLTT